MEVIVEDQAAVARHPGRRARTCAWREAHGLAHRIKSEEEKRREVEAQFGELEAAATRPSGEAGDAATIPRPTCPPKPAGRRRARESGS